MPTTEDKPLVQLSPEAALAQVRQQNAAIIELSLSAVVRAEKQP
jgi:hypothetical protein